jgi:hypothetical protein
LNEDAYKLFFIASLGRVFKAGQSEFIFFWSLETWSSPWDKVRLKIELNGTYDV